jgi:hypothetical protein
MARSRSKKKGALLELPPLPHAEAHQRLLKRLSEMSTDEIFETIVRAGICTKDGRLTKPYRTPRDPAPAAT